MSTEQTLLLFARDGAATEAITRLEARGFGLVGLKLLRASAALAAQHHAPLVADRDFRSLVSRLAGARVSALAFEGAGVVEAARELVAGLAQAVESIASASASPAAAQRELCLWFGPAELVGASAAGRSAPGKGEADAELNFAIAAASAGAASAGDLEAGVGAATAEKVQKRDKVRAAHLWRAPGSGCAELPGGARGSRRLCPRALCRARSGLQCRPHSPRATRTLKPSPPACALHPHRAAPLAVAMVP